MFLIDPAYDWTNFSNLRKALCECGFKVVTSIAELVKHIDKSVLTAKVPPKAPKLGRTLWHAEATLGACW